MGKGGGGAGSSKKKKKSSTSKKQKSAGGGVADTSSTSEKRSSSNSNPIAEECRAKRGNDPRLSALPAELKRLRACMICSLIKTESEFEQEGCNNCEAILQLAGTRGAVDSYTSINFDFGIGLMEPTDSWVARWMGITHYTPGIYAINVRGELQNWVKKELKDAGLQYYSRDKSKQATKQ